MSGEICTDNRFEIITAYKKKLIKETNIEARPDEMAVIDNILFRFWQMGWLLPIPHGRLIDAGEMVASVKRQTEIMREIAKEVDKLKPIANSKELDDVDIVAIAETVEKGVLQEIANAPTIIPAEEDE